MKKIKNEQIGLKMWVSGNCFVLYKTDNIMRYLGCNLKKISLEKQEVTIISPELFMLKNGDIFLI